MQLKAIASAIFNHVVSGLAGINSNIKISIEQLEDECLEERNRLVKEALLKGILTLDEMYLALNCVEVDCDYMSKCNTCNSIFPVGEKALHFEIPPIISLVNGISTIKFIGSVDRKVKYNVYTDESYKFHKYKKRGANYPYVYLDTTINARGNIDGYIFNIPFVKYISVIALFKDPRRLLEWDCCAENPNMYSDCGILSEQIINNLTQRYIYFYKQAATPVTPNNQQPR